MKQFKHICLGGTFDRLHEGHIRMLDFAFHLGDKVSIGVSTPEMTKGKQSREQIEPYQSRFDSIKTYLSSNSFDSISKIFPLKTIYGIADTEADLDAIIVTRESKPNAVKINLRRKENGLSQLAIVSVPFFKGNDNKIVRSERIRSGRINRSGESYLNQLTASKELTLPPRLRELLRKPLGIIIEGEERFADFTARKSLAAIKRLKPTRSILVGDIVTQSFVKAGYHADIQIIDHRSRRKDLISKQKAPKNRISNPPGTIRKDAVIKLKQLLDTESKTTQTLVVKGEEDLLALPAVLLAPIGAVVVYGQYDMGIIITQVTESKKEQVAGIIRQFE